MLSSFAAAITLFSALGLVDPASTADQATLKDGAILVGEVVEPPTRGEVDMVVRRDWVREHLPARAVVWEKAESVHLKRATQQRRARLAAWKSARAAVRSGPDDRITPWLDQEIARLGKAPEKAEATLMVVKLRATEIKTMHRRPRNEPNWLRMGWLAKFPHPETMAPDDLKLALEGRGYDPTSTAPVAIDSLLPIREESESLWLSRRGATEVMFDPGLRFIRHEGFVMPEPAVGQPLDLANAGLALSALKNLLDDKPEDPLVPRLREVAAKGYSSAMVTQLILGADMAGVTIEIGLWVRPGPSAEQWTLAGKRVMNVQADQLAADAGKGLAEDPQIKSVFQLAESLGLGGVSAELKQKSLNIGAATQQALGLAKKAAESDLSILALDIKKTP